MATMKPMSSMGWAVCNLSRTSIVDENGTRFATWRYDEKGRAISSEHGDAQEKVTLDYQDLATTVINASGNRNNYAFAKTVDTPKLKKQAQPAGSGCSASTQAQRWQGQYHRTHRF